MDGRSMEARVARLERECRRWRLAGVVAVGIALVAGAAQKPPDVVRARRLEVVDDKGRGRVVLEAADDVTGMVLKDRTGRPAAWLGLYDDDSPALNFLRAGDGELVACLRLMNGRTPGLFLVGQDGREAYMAVPKSGPTLQMKGAKGEVLFRAPAAGK
jgi:hypothetical protein